MKVVCIGDSLTYGYGLYKEKCWVDLLRRGLNIRVLNRGVNGDTISGMLSRSFRDIVENKPDIAIIMGGSNDFLAGYSLHRVQENIIEIIKETKQFGVIPIMGIQIPIEELLAAKIWSDNLDYSVINDKIKEYRKWVIKYCEENHVKYIDFYGAIEEKRQCTTSQELYIDGLHPTEYGHGIMAKNAIQVLKTLGC